MSQIRALVAGLTTVNAQAYGGWDGRCPGCDVDCTRTADQLLHLGATVRRGLNQVVTNAWAQQAGRDLVRGLEPGDLLMLYLSGHGGQEQDLSGDEDDGLDETLCLYDGEMSDDTVGKLLEGVPQGVLIFSCFDTCNSGTSTRSRPPSRRIAAVSEKLYEYAERPHLHFGGCGDGKSSYGSAPGGEFTTALWHLYEKGITWQEWFDRVSKAMPARQKPAMDVIGDFPVNSAALQP